MQKTAVILEARTQSTRFRNKIFKKLGKYYVLEFLINRLKKGLSFDVIVATSLNKKDIQVQKFCERKKIQFFRGKENDLIDRVINCADYFNVDVIISLTGDNPLVDPKMIKKMLTIFNKKKLDYFDNLNTSFLPKGIAIRIIKRKILKKFSDKVKSNRKYNFRQHTTYFFMKNKNSKLFKTKKFDLCKNYSLPNYSFTIDYQQDYKKIKILLKKFNYNFNIELLKIINFIKLN
tara:strand:- start:1307 stop:2005 length:699 start_codon:yes stop_codon:yes gene_type:complete